MKITKRQLKRLIREEKSRMLNEQTDGDAQRFEEIMIQLAELVEEAFEISNRPEAARGYWYNGILARIDPGQHGMANRSYSMVDTLKEMGGGEDEDMMEKGYMDGLNDVEPQHPDNEYYMVNWKDGNAESENRR